MARAIHDAKLRAETDRFLTQRSHDPGIANGFRRELRPDGTFPEIGSTVPAGARPLAEPDAIVQLLDVARYLRDAPDAVFDMCSDVTATDWPPRAERFDVIYCLYSTRHRHRVRVKVRAAEHQPVRVGR